VGAIEGFLLTIVAVVVIVGVFILLFEPEYIMIPLTILGLAVLVVGLVLIGIAVGGAEIYEQVKSHI
jgi:hypothetical protein